MAATGIKPFKIHVPDQKLQELQQKLALTTFPSELEDAGWVYGSPLSDIKALTSHWRTDYSWRSTEKRLNDYLPQFMTKIQVDGFGGIDVHFVHRKAKVDGVGGIDRGRKAIPLLFVHGWPGSFMEVERILGGLNGDWNWGGEGKGNREVVFDVVAPSLPNYGFSEPVKKKGFALKQYAETCHKLMLRLGYNEYVTQGGDWGSFITRTMALLYGPKHVKAHHINMSYAHSPSQSTTPTNNPSNISTRTIKTYTPTHPQPSQLPLTPREQFLQNRRLAWESGTERGYFAMQSTKPATLAFSISDSPVGLLAWIYDKLRSWTDSYDWTNDEVLDWVSIYWFSTAGCAAGFYTYFEIVNDSGLGIEGTRGWIDVPLGIAHFPYEILSSPIAWNKSLGPVVSETSFERGGHFAAWEVPELLVEAVREMFGKGGRFGLGE